jgi:hypothetical protein
MNSQNILASASELRPLRLGVLGLVLSLGLQGCSSGGANRSHEQGEHLGFRCRYAVPKTS